MILEGMICAAI